eukprot:scaffold14913_cov124-Isochrysis_galbana.AAC.2
MKEKDQVKAFGDGDVSTSTSAGGGGGLLCAGCDSRLIAFPTRVTCDVGQASRSITRPPGGVRAAAVAAARAGAASDAVLSVSVSYDERAAEGHGRMGDA